ncbi:MAG: hypothetical protein U0572_17700 [Phycisphaerales bacterium]
MADVSDKRRLRQVAQQDLTESRLNDDFLFWLKTKGINWALVILIIACGVMFWNNWKQRREQARDAAWADLTQASLPQSFDEVAKQHAADDPIALFAWLRAGDMHLRDLQSGFIGGTPMPGPDGTVPAAEPLNDESRKVAQDSADAYFQKVLDGTVGKTDNPALVPFRLSALFGKAAVAESRGDLNAASTMLNEAKALAQTPYPKFAEQAQSRLDSLPMLAKAAEIPSRASLPARSDAAGVQPASADELIKSLQGGGAPPPVQVQPGLTPTPVNQAPPLLRPVPEAPPTAQPARPTPPPSQPSAPPANAPKPGG